VLTALERAAAEFLRGVDRVQQLVVVRTGPGQAQSLAFALDRARLPDVVGTIGGDDTILVIARGARAAAALTKRLKDYSSE
jgi:transcriptional regulator of arginine metabolism